MKMRLIPVLLVLAVLLALAAPGLMAAAADPIWDLAEAVAYWQEQALLAAMERNVLREELAHVKAERDALLQDRNALEAIMARLQPERDAALANARAEAALREQAERDLTMAMQTITSLQDSLKRLAGPRFGLLLGATYDIRAGDPGVMAALQFSFK